MVIRALSVFEGVVYHCYSPDQSNPCRPTLEVEAVVREGDVDSGPLLVTLSDYAALAAPNDVMPCIEELARRGRIVERMGVKHLSFPTWTPIELEQR
jgi:hypothetical protein